MLEMAFRSGVGLSGKTSSCVGFLWSPLLVCKTLNGNNYLTVSQTWPSGAENGLWCAASKLHHSLSVTFNYTF